MKRPRFNPRKRFFFHAAWQVDKEVGNKDFYLYEFWNMSFVHWKCANIWDEQKQCSNGYNTVIGSFYCLISHDLPHLINSTPWRCWRCNCCWKWWNFHFHCVASRPWAVEVGFFTFFEPKNALSLRNIIGVDDLWFLMRKMVFAPENGGTNLSVKSVKPENP